MPAPKPVARVFTPAPLDPRFPNGFSFRWYHFTRALERSFELDVAAIRGIWDIHLPHHVFRLDFPVRRFDLLHAIRRPPLQDAPAVLRQQLAGFFAHFDSRRLGPRVLDGDRALAPPPDVAVFFSDLVAHLAFELPTTTRCVFVLEEGLIRNPEPPGAATDPATEPSGSVTRRLAQRRYGRFVRRCGQRGNIVAINDVERDWFARFVPPGRITVIPPGIDLAEYSPAPGEPDHDVAIIGDLSQERNYQPAAELIGLAQQHDGTRNLRWLLVGRDPHAALQGFPADRVTLTGAVPDVRAFYPRARIIAVPASRVTGSKSTLLQAWGMQRPVVATPEATAGLPAVPGANVLVGKDRADLLARIRELLLDPARAQALAAAGRKAVIESCDLGVSARAFASVCEREVKDGLSRGIR